MDKKELYQLIENIIYNNIWQDYDKELQEFPLIGVPSAIEKIIKIIEDNYVAK